MEFYSLEVEEMQKDKRELESLLGTILPEFRVVCRVQMLKRFLDNHKRGINKCPKRPKICMKLLKVVSKRL